MRHSAYGHDATGQLAGLKTQKTYIQTLVIIATKVDDVTHLIDASNQEQDASAQINLNELKRIQVLSEPDMSSSLEIVIAGIASEGHSTREEIIASNISSMQKQIGKDRYVNLKARLVAIGKWYTDGDLAQAIIDIDAAIESVEDEIRAEDTAKHLAWEQAKEQAKTTSQKKWDDKRVKILSNKENYIKDLIDVWNRGNPEPQVRI